MTNPQQQISFKELREYIDCELYTTVSIPATFTDAEVAEQINIILDRVMNRVLKAHNASLERIEKKMEEKIDIFKSTEKFIEWTRYDEAFYKGMKSMLSDLNEILKQERGEG